MNTIKSFIRSKLLCALISMAVIMPQGAFAAPVITQSNVPLITATANTVKPNILFSLDDSGSMSWGGVPDLVWDTNGPNFEDHNYIYKAAEFNAIAYNPATVYNAPIKSFNTNGDPVYFPTQNNANTTGWTQVKTNGFSATVTGNVENLAGGDTLFYYTFIPGEFCNSAKLENCQGTYDATTFKYPAAVRWCNNNDLANNHCKALSSGGTNGYNKPRYAAMGNWKATITISGGSGTRSVSSILVDGKQIMSASASGSSNNNLATQIVTRINACTDNINIATESCQINGFSANRVNSVVTIWSPHGGVTAAPVVQGLNAVFTASTFSYTDDGNPDSGGVPDDINYPVANTAGKRIRVAILPAARLNSYPYPGTSAKHQNRTDCTGAVCTYEQEMTNYANWHAYYRTRMQTMKSAVGFAFQGLDDKFRVGFNTINYTGTSDSDNRFLGVSDFTISQKNTWYTKLATAGGTSSTPLRSALSKMGRYFAGRIGTDPVQFSCQQNFGILSSDGYWNTGDPVKLNGSAGVGNQDSDSSALSKKAGYWEGSDPTVDTLADVAMYYYKTDLRDGTNCSNVAYQGRNLCENNVFTSLTDTAKHQHMTTFTMGLGIDGNLQYIDDYVNQPGDFKNMVTTGTPMWGNAEDNASEARVDDLWHAAVNGRGSYFSAKSPDAVVAGFRKVLEDIGAKTSPSGGVTKSSEDPVAGSDKSYKVAYTSNLWTGNVIANTLLAAGGTDASPLWCVEDVLAEDCSTPSVLGTNGSGQTTCTRIGPFGSCGAGETLNSSGNCVKVIQNSCEGTLKTRIPTPSSDTRDIYVSNGSGNPIQFSYGTLPATVRPYFEQTYLTAQGLTQFNDGTLDAAQKTAASGTNLVNYLRGRTQHDASNADTAQRYYRKRAATLGDVTDFRPAFVGAPVMNYTDLTDPGYPSYKSSNAGRGKTVFVGANDGMLHAFDGNDGRERWAFIPTAVMSKMWTLADTQYASKHVNFVNGKVFQADVNSGGWKTIIVGGLGSGGKGYYALDVTDPASPKVLWEINESNFPNIGYAHGRPLIAKVKSGSTFVWAVLLASGYNNADGVGRLYVVDAVSGSLIKTISTNSGSAGAPSGLSEVNAWADDRIANAETSWAYGGDLDGKVWRFDLDNGTASVLADFGPSQPITTIPELARIEDFRVVYVATGKYVESSDLSTSGTQSLYAIADKGKVGSVTRSDLIAQSISGGGDRRTSTNNIVDWTSTAVHGWRTDFPDVGERVAVNPRLVAGMLFVLSTVPVASDCSPGGYSWKNYFNYETGGNIPGTTYTGQKTDGILFDMGLYIQDGLVVFTGYGTGGSGGLEDPDASAISGGGGTEDFSSVRLMWREMIQ